MYCTYLHKTTKVEGDFGTFAGQADARLRRPLITDNSLLVEIKRAANVEYLHWYLLSIISSLMARLTILPYKSNFFRHNAAWE